MTDGHIGCSEQLSSCTVTEIKTGKGSHYQGFDGSKWQLWCEGGSRQYSIEMGAVGSIYEVGKWEKAKT